MVAARAIIQGSAAVCRISPGAVRAVDLGAVLD